MEKNLEDRAVVLNNEETFEGYIHALMVGSALFNDKALKLSQEYDRRITEEDFDLVTIIKMRHILEEMHARVATALHSVERAEATRRFVECPHDVASVISNEKSIVRKRKERKEHGE